MAAIFGEVIDHPLCRSLHLRPKEPLRGRYYVVGELRVDQLQRLPHGLPLELGCPRRSTVSHTPSPLYAARRRLPVHLLPSSRINVIRPSSWMRMRSGDRARLTAPVCGTFFFTSALRSFLMASRVSVRCCDHHCTNASGRCPPMLIVDRPPRVVESVKHPANLVAVLLDRVLQRGELVKRSSGLRKSPARLREWRHASTVARAPARRVASRRPDGPSCSAAPCRRR